MATLTPPAIALPPPANRDEQWFVQIKDVVDRLNKAVLQGNGSPAGSIVADVGTLYRRLDGGASTTLYIKESGSGTSAGWRAV